jgi:polar amino acid transport system substrate-binding protein
VIGKLKLLAILFSVALAVSACTAAAPNPSQSATIDTRIYPSARAALPNSVLRSGKLKVAIDTTYAPNEFKDSLGNPVGWEVEIMHAIGIRLGVKVEYHQVVFGSIIPGVRNGTYDMAISSFFDTPERQKLVDLVDYYSAGILWVQKTGSPAVDSASPCGLQVAAQSGTFESDTDLPEKSSQCVSKKQAPITILQYASQDDATDAVKLGRVAAFAADSPVSLYAIKQSFGSLSAAGKTYSILDYGMPVKHKSRLAWALHEALKSMVSDGTYLSILNSWGVKDGAIGTLKINGVAQ